MSRILIVLTAIALLPVAHSAETYSAIEPGAIDVTMVAVPQSVTPTLDGEPVRPKAARKATKPRTLPRAAKTSPDKVKELPPTPEPVAVVSGNRFGFDPVPEAHAESVARRLTIVGELIRRHGRAYDYRGLTTQELEELRDELDRASGTLPSGDTDEP